MRAAAGEDGLTIEQAAELLSVSAPTVRNWVRLGKLTMGADGRFCRRDIEEQTAASASLQARRNKKRIFGQAVYTNYSRSAVNRRAAEYILDAYGGLAESGLRGLMAALAVQLCRERYGQLDDGGVFGKLISGLCAGAEIPQIPDCRLSFVPGEDTLGFIYISLRDLGRRKRGGIYYTPPKAAGMLLDSLSSCPGTEEGTMLDPSCGTGSFLMGLVQRGISPSRLYGCDIDEVSVWLARINMFLLDGTLTWEHLVSHIVCGDALKGAVSGQFAAVLGNPPWGYDYSPAEREYFCRRFRTAKKSGAESCALFLEKGLELLEEGGYLSYLLPQALFTSAIHRSARELLAETVSFKSVTYLEKAFGGVQCPAVILTAKKGGGISRCRVTYGGRSFMINGGRRETFSFTADDREYSCLTALEEAENTVRLGGCARFALGIVTGDNKRFLLDAPEEGAEPVLRGRDILRFSIKQPQKYIRFTPELFQQTAAETLYRAPQKLVYRFVAGTPVFACDTGGRLTLNSCNILLPWTEGLDIRYIMAVLNSAPAAFFLAKRFPSMKLLRSHIEAVPIPAADDIVQRRIARLTEEMEEDPLKRERLYAEINGEITELYGLSPAHRRCIEEYDTGGRSFLL